MSVSSRPRKQPPEKLGRPAASRERDARELLITSATQLFAEQGVAASTFSAIAKRAGLTPAMVHYYFRDREHLMDTVVEERLVPFITSVWEPVKPGDDPIETLRGVVQRLLTGIERAPWVPSTWVREILNEGGLLRTKALRRIPRDKVQLVAEAIHRGQAARALNPDINPLLVVFSALGLVMLHMATIKVWSEIFQRPPLSHEAMRCHITALLLDGLRRPPRPSHKPVRGKRSQRRKP